MNKITLKYYYISFLFILLFLTILFAFNVTAQEPQFFPNMKYSSTITLEYDATILENPIPTENGVVLPITLTFSTELQKESYSIIPENLLYRFYFGTTDLPQQTIQLEFTKPTDIDLSFDKEQITFDIPFDDNSYQTTVNLTIVPTNKARALSYSININASSDAIYRLNGSSVEKRIVITPAYNPCATISKDKSMDLYPSELNSTKISITNCGNSEVKVTPKLKSNVENITVVICPTYLVLNSDESESFNISILASSSFEGITSLDFNFTIEKLPAASNDKIIYRNTTIDCNFIDSDEDNFFLSPLFIIIVMLVISNIIFIGKYKRFW